MQGLFFSLDNSNFQFLNYHPLLGLMKNLGLNLAKIVVDFGGCEDRDDFCI